MMKESYEDDTFCYEGQWKNDMSREQGKSYHNNGTIEYDGQWENNLSHGQESHIAKTEVSNMTDNGKRHG